MSFILFIIASIVSYVFSYILFFALNKSILQLFVSIQIFIAKSRREKLIQRIALFLNILLSAVVANYIGINIKSGIIIGIILGFNEIIFKIEGTRYR